MELIKCFRRTACLRTSNKNWCPFNLMERNFERVNLSRVDYYIRARNSKPFCVVRVFLTNKWTQILCCCDNVRSNDMFVTSPCTKKLSIDNFHVNENICFEIAECIKIRFFYVHVENIIKMFVIPSKSSISSIHVINK